MKKQKGMENRKIRKYLSVGQFGILLVDTDIPLSVFNSNLKAFRVVARYNEIRRLINDKEMAKTHTAEPIYDMLGNYTGFRWVRR